MRFSSCFLGPLAVATAMLGACSADVQTPERYASSEKQDRDYRTYGTFHGGDGFTLWSSSEEEENGSGFGGGLAINPFLWRAALEATNFMPLAQTDPVGGVIISDWYSPPETPDERFKLTVYVLDRELRADAVKVSVFRQVRDGGSWRDAAVDPATAGRIEDNILTLARELRVASLDAAG